MASLIRCIENLIVEYGEVEGQAKTDWVSWSQIGMSNFSGSFISLKGLVGRSLALVANGELSQVTVIITLPVDIN